MSGSEKISSRREFYKTPFSRAYWAQAVSEFKSLRVLVFAALMIALRVALKSVSIPIAANLRINVAFFINAYGAMVFGPVVAIAAAAISDTLGCILFPTGVYFFPFIFIEIAGSLIFALFLYRTEITALKVTLSRFCIDFFVNIVLNTPVMWLYYQMMMGRNYAIFDALRIVKNLAMFPIESVLLTLFLRLVIPPVYRLKYVHSGVDKLKFTGKNILALALMLALGIGAVTGYYVNDYNTKSFSASYSAQERLNRNREMNAWVAEVRDDLAESDIVTIIESARSRIGNPEMTYELAVYRIDSQRFQEKAAADGNYTLSTLQGYSKSKAAADDALLRIGSYTAVTDKKTGEHLRLEATTE